MDIDRPLEDIIKSNKTRRGGAGRGAAAGAGAGAGAGGGSKSGGGGGARDRYAGNAPRSRNNGNGAPRQAAVAPARGGVPAGLAADATKIIISNLPADVNEAAVRDLLQSTVGPVRSVQMSYTATGKSSGTATVVFKNKGDANKAHASYNNRMIDNQRPMKVEIALDMNQLQSLASRVAPPPKAAAAAPRAAAQKAKQPKQKKERPAAKTAEELDAEMNAYKAA